MVYFSRTAEFSDIIIIIGFNDIELGQGSTVGTSVGPVAILVTILSKNPWFLALF